MNDNAVALSFISNIGLKNLRNKDVVKLVQEYLNDIENKIDDTLNIAASIPFKLDSTTLNKVTYNIKKPTVYYENDLEISKQSSRQVQLLEHMIVLRNEECLNSLDDVKTKSFLSLSKSMLLDSINKSRWHTFIDDAADKEAAEISWDYIPSLVSILMVSMKLEDYLKLNESIVFPLLANNILYSFRYMFQSETSNLCVIDHPEWAISYMKDRIKRYTPVFKRIKRELKTEETMYFDAFMDGTNLETDKREELFNEFSILCKESANVDYLSKWCHLLATELRLFVFSRLPLLVYDYYKMPHEKLVKLSELAEIISMKSVIDLRVTRSFFEDEIKINVLYTMMNSLVDLATFMRPMCTVSSYELFSDFDCNTPIPYIKLDYGDAPEHNEISLEYESKHIYGAMDALISLESIYTMNVLKKVLNDEGIYDSISYKNLTQVAVYLQDDKYSAQISSIIISLLKSIDGRCRCLNFIESKSKYTIEIVVPIITYFIDSLKHKWNSIGDILESCSLACFLLESSNVLYAFLLKYPESQFMSSTITTLDGITNKMITIIGQYVVDLIYEPFKHIHETPLDVINVLTHKLLEMSALCTQKTHDKIVKQTMEAIELTLISVLIPNKRHDYIIYNENHIDIIIQNCFYISNTLKSNIDQNKCASCIELVEDFLTLLQLETIELKMISEYLDVLSATMLCSINATSDTNGHLATSGSNLNTSSSIHSSDGTAIYTDLLDSDDDDSSRNQNTTNDNLITEHIRRKIKVKKLDLTKIYTFVMHMLNGISHEFAPDASVPHVDGNFHTLCYIQVPLSNQLINIARKSFSTLNKLVKIDHKLFGSVNDVESQSSISEEEGECVNSNGQSSTKLDRNYAHLSLCKPLYLKRQFIDSFLDKLRRMLERVKPFYLLLNTSVTICANELYTRYFAVLPVSDLSRNESILPIINLVDKVVQSFGYPKYYIQRQPHVSLSSTTRDLASTLNRLYKEEDRVKYSSHHWSSIDEILERWSEAWNYNGDDTTILEAVEYNVNVPEAALEEAVSNLAYDEDICIYINEIHVLIGAKDVVITLQ